jgi:hypothetical protein
VRRLAAYAAIAIVIAVALAAGCSDGDEEPPRPLPVDERQGAVGGVRIGASKREVRERFGDYGSDPGAYPIEPLEIDEDEGSGGPWSVVTGPHHLGPGGIKGEQVTLRYRGASLFVRHDRVFGFMVTDRGGTTMRGVRVGDRLEKAKERYPAFRCDEEWRGETTAPQKANCSGVVSDDLLTYFGGDPIESITVVRRSSLPRR